MTDRLYDLLPAVYRRCDAEAGETLRRFLQVFEEELERHEGDAWRAYDNWFIETCEEEAVPLIGELVGVHLPHPVTDVTRSQRAWVANAIARRRRKGTASSLDDLARDVTGYDATLVEYFQRLAVAWQAALPSRRTRAFCALRDPLPLEAIGRAGDESARTVDLRSITAGRGRHHPAHAGVHLWRLRAQPPVRALARPAVAGTADGRYRAHPSGLDAPLWHGAGHDPRIPGAGPLSRLALHQELEARRQAIVDGVAPPTRWFGDEPVFQVWVNGTPIPPEEVAIADLSRELAASPWWPRPPASAPYPPAAGGAPVNLPIRVLVDPTNGRLSFRAPEEGGVAAGATVEVTARLGMLDVLGASAAPRPDLLGGSFARPAEAERWFERTAGTPDELRAAVSDWNAASAAAAGPFVGRIEVAASLVLEGAALEVSVPRLARVLVTARDGERPTLRAPLHVTGTAGASDPDPGALALDGFALDGGVEVRAGSLGALTLAHCTALLFGTASWSVLCLADNGRLRVRLLRSVVHSVRAAPALAGIDLEDSALCAPGGHGVLAMLTPLSVQRSTVFANCMARRLDASDSVFMDTLGVTEAAEGCVRYSYLAAPGAVRRYACVVGRPGPRFTSDDPALPAFAQLGPGTPRAVAEGASNGAEMGVFNRLQQPQRAANLRQCLDEHLPAGLDAGVFYET